MQPLSQDIRKKFLSYFHKKQHAIISSSSVVPHDDPTLLFANAGMNQFKDLFLGKAERDFKRAATAQKCIRGGGKHNDLDNVGHTSRHLTFFEMLGNFSFGDYFKKEAIQYAWEATTEVFGFDPEHVWITVFREDDEAEDLWRSFVKPNRIVRLDEKDNFWAMGDTGPCGPCSELYFDRGAAYGSGSSPQDDATGERYLEFWNLVFMQYNRSNDGKMVTLPKQSIDTGAGLERVISLKMGVDSVFLTDILRSLIAEVENKSGRLYGGPGSATAPAFHVIADHLRSLTFAISDGAQPSNTDRGYVLRKLLRRAVRYGRQLGLEKPFLSSLLSRLVNLMGEDYPEIQANQERVADILQTEEEAFLRTLQRGGALLSQVMESSKKTGFISGDDAFKLKDTYGLPFEEITLLAKDSHLSLDTERYKHLEEEARQRSKASMKNVSQTVTDISHIPHSAFVGYNTDKIETKILAIHKEGQTASSLQEGEKGSLFLEETPFYAEKGGQVGDTGYIGHFRVINTLSPAAGIIEHVGVLEKGEMRVGQRVQAQIDKARRFKIRSNHTATHLLHYALGQVLGDHIRQAGSLVDDEKIRFDFSHHKALSPEEIAKLEDIVNEKIRENSPVKAYELSYDEAQKDKGIKQFFGDKYGKVVRVIDIDFSKELCGGTHAASTGHIGYFRINRESSIAAGTRRIEAVTGKEAEALARQDAETVQKMAFALKGPQILERLTQLQEALKTAEAETKELKNHRLKEIASHLLSEGSIIVAEVALPPGDLKALADLMTSQKPSSCILLGAKEKERCALLAKMPKGSSKSAQKLIMAIAPLVEGSGGGKDEFAQGFGKAPLKLTEALEAGKVWLNS